MNSRFTEEQIAYALKQVEVHAKIDEVCRKLGISDATFSSGAKGTAVWVHRSCAD